MRRLLPLVALALGTAAHADPNAPLMFLLAPEQDHAYQNDPPPPLTLTLTIRNPTPRPVALTCRAVGGPVLRRFTEVQDGQAVHRDEALGRLLPQGGSPVCRQVGEVLTVPPGRQFTYTRALGLQKVGAQLHYRAGWNVSVRPGSGWLQHAYAPALVVAQDRPIPTPSPQAYQEALNVSRARVFAVGRGTGRLSYFLADDLSRKAFLTELKRRGLDVGKIEIEVAPPVRLPGRPTFPHTATVTTTRTAQGYTFTLKVTNTSSGAVEGGMYSACEPLAIERVSDLQRVWQEGNGPCISLGMPRVTLQPGESTSREARWGGTDSLGQPVMPGQYRVRMRLGQFVGEAVLEVK